MAYITDSVGQGGKNLTSDVKIIQWMLLRAQTHYGINLFDRTYDIEETGLVDLETTSAIRAIIKYRKKASGITDIISTPPPLSLSSGVTLFPDSAIAPDDANYKYLLKCSLKPICLTPMTNVKEDFNDDSLAVQAFNGKLSFQAFKNAAIAKDDANCGESESNGKGSPYYTIDANIVLEADAIAVLDKIGPLYFKEVKEKFNVNSGTRTSDRQASAMYTVYMSGDKTFSLYRNRTVANQLVNIIKNGQAAGKNKTGIVKDMTDLIQKNFEKGIYMSSHQRAGAIDIAIVGDKPTGVKPMTSAQKKIMMKIAFKVTGFKALLEKRPPHIHIKFK